MDAKDEFDGLEASRPRSWPWTRAASSRPAACASYGEAGQRPEARADGGRAGRCAGSGVGAKLLAGAEDVGPRARRAARWCCTLRSQAQRLLRRQRLPGRGRALHGGRDRARPDDEAARGEQRAARRDPHRPAHRAAHDPRRRAGPSARSTGARDARQSTTRAAPSARATSRRHRPRSGPTARTAARPKRPGLARARRPQPLPRAGRPTEARTDGRRDGAHRRRRRTRCGPRRAPASPTCSAPVPASGVHEVIIHSPRHRTSLAELDDGELAAAVSGWRARMRDHAEAAACVQLIVNEGGGAGASPRALATPSSTPSTSCRCDRPRARALHAPTTSGRWAATCSPTSPARRCAARSAWSRSTTRRW